MSDCVNKEENREKRTGYVERVGRASRRHQHCTHRSVVPPERAKGR